MFEYKSLSAIYGPLVLLMIPVDPVGLVPGGAVVVARKRIVVVPLAFELVYCILPIPESSRIVKFTPVTSPVKYDVISHPELEGLKTPLTSQKAYFDVPALTFTLMKALKELVMDVSK